MVRHRWHAAKPEPVRALTEPRRHEEITTIPFLLIIKNPFLPVASGPRRDDRLDVYAAREPLSESMSVSPLGRQPSLTLASDTDSDDDDIAPPTSSVPPFSALADAMDAGGSRAA